MMPIHSPLSGVKDALIQVRDAAKAHKKAFQGNEGATRTALVDPLLRALGWHVTEMAMVETERKATFANSVVRADYALLDRNGRVRAVLTIKSPGHDLKLEWNKMATLASAFGVSAVFLTDGLLWHSFELQGVNAARLAPTILDLSAEDAGKAALFFVQALDASFFWPEEQTAESTLLDMEQLRSDVASLKQQLAALRGGGLAPLGAALTAGWIPLDSITSVKNTKPSRFQLPSKQEVSVKYWKDVLLESCKYALAVNPTLLVPFPDRAGQKLIDTLPPASGVSYITVSHQGRPVYIVANYDPLNCVANALHILNDRTVMPKQVTKPAVIFG